VKWQHQVRNKSERCVGDIREVRGSPFGRVNGLDHDDDSTIHHNEDDCIHHGDKCELEHDVVHDKHDELKHCVLDVVHDIDNSDDPLIHDIRGIHRDCRLEPRIDVDNNCGVLLKLI